MGARGEAAFADAIHKVNGIDMHVVEHGHGPAVLLCHGWPEIWYSWRHQIPALAEAGYRVIVPDMRGYGETEAPSAVDAYTIYHLVGDMVGLLDALEIESAAVVGHDWGAPVAWNAALMRPDRFRAVAGLSVPYSPRGGLSLTEAVRRAGLERFYMLYFQQVGVAEAELERDVRDSLTRIYHNLSGDNPDPKGWSAMVAKDGGLLDGARLPDAPSSWLADGDLDRYVAAFEKNGFCGGLNWYRNLDRNWELLAPFHRAPVTQPSLFIAGARDPVLRMAGMRSAVDNLATVCPSLTGAHIIDGAGHWVQQEAPDVVNDALLAFLRDTMAGTA